MFYYLILTLLFIDFKLLNALSSHPLILVVSLDAFRHDYIEKGVTPVIAKLRKEGCWAEHLDNVFMTKTYPNHHSISTGYYPDTHGVMGNSFFDPKIGKKVDYSYEMFHFNDEAVPIWIENEKQGHGRHSGVMMWPGNEYNYSGVGPTFKQPWDDKVPFEDRIDTVISWYKHPKTPINFGMLYLEEPDAEAHARGPESPGLLNMLKEVDKTMQSLLDKLEKNELLNKVNLFLISDHGMLQVTRKNIIDLRPFVNETLYDRYSSTPVLHIFPKNGSEEQVYEGLKAAERTLGNFRTFKKAEIPSEWHYSNSRTPPITLVADPPYVFNDFYESIHFYEKELGINATDSTPFGVHGYDNQVSSMKPFFIASGPAIRNKTQVPPFRTIDLFSLWAELLGFPEAARDTDGNMVAAKTVLRANHVHVSTSSIIAGLTGGFLVLLAMGITVYFVHKKLQHKYHVLLQTDVRSGEESQQLLYSDEEEA